jgi:prophage antirepressor-like protein
MSEIKIFESKEFGKVRTVVLQNGEIYFVGIDVAKALEYAEPHKAISAHCDGGISYPLTDSLGREQNTKVIPRGDLVRLVVQAAKQSKNPNVKEKAKRFESWVFDEVIPTVMEHGAYMTPETIEKILFNPDFMIKLALRLKELQDSNKRLENKIKENAPIVRKYKIISKRLDEYNMKEVSRIISERGNRKIGITIMLDFLRWQKILMPSNLPYQKYMNSEHLNYSLGYNYYSNNKKRKSQGFQPVATGKGLDLILDLWEKHGKEYLKLRKENHGRNIAHEDEKHLIVSNEEYRDFLARWHADWKTLVNGK